MNSHCVLLGVKTGDPLVSQKSLLTHSFNTLLGASVGKIKSEQK
jgi:hypothetical protein